MTDTVKIYSIEIHEGEPRVFSVNAERVGGQICLRWHVNWAGKATYIGKDGPTITGAESEFDLTPDAAVDRYVATSETWCADMQRQLREATAMLRKVKALRDGVR